MVQKKNAIDLCSMNFPQHLPNRFKRGVDFSGFHGPFSGMLNGERNSGTRWP